MEGLISIGRSPLLLNPVTTSEYADEVLYGMTCTVLEDLGGYLKVRMEYGYEGWLPNTAFNEMSCQEWQQKRNAIIITSSADLLPEPAYRGMPAITLLRGAYVEWIGPSGTEGWEVVTLADGSRGYMRREWLRLVSGLADRSANELRQAIVADAQLYLGTIYKWGGKSPLGIDCSGLAFMAYWLNGLSIYRDAKIVEGYGVKPIDIKAIQKGDLLFYPGHVTLYLGEHLFIHSKGACGGVVIHSLDPSNPRYNLINMAELKAVGSYFVEVKG